MVKIEGNVTTLQGEQNSFSTLRSTRKARKVSTSEASDQADPPGETRGQKINRLLMISAEKRGNAYPTNFDVTPEIAGLIIDFTRPESCVNPLYNQLDHKSLIIYYYRCLQQVEWYMEGQLLRGEAAPCPTVFNPKWVRHSWWWCQPSPSLRALIRARYHGLPAAPCRDAWLQLEVDPVAENRARLDPFFAAW